jgi:hypothetical protein
MSIGTDGNEGFRVDDDFVCVAKECKLEFADMFCSILKASSEHKIKLMPNSADGSTGSDHLNTVLTAYYLSRSCDQENSRRTSPSKAFYTDVSRLMADIALRGRIFSADAAIVAADVSWVLLQSQCMKPKSPRTNIENWEILVQTANDASSPDRIESKATYYAQLIRTHWSWRRNERAPHAFDQVRAWARQNPRILRWYKMLMGTTP